MWLTALAWIFGVGYVTVTGYHLVRFFLRPTPLPKEGATVWHEEEDPK